MSGKASLTDVYQRQATEIDGKLANEEIVERALVWKSGMTYYYNENKHLNDAAYPVVILIEKKSHHALVQMCIRDSSTGLPSS